MVNQTSRYRRHPELPQELKDEIVGYLSTDRESLKVCSLSHSSFLAISQKWLFAMVALEGGDSRSSGHNFKTLLQDSPHLANYIQCIKLVEASWNGKDQWLPQDTTLLATLPLLRHLSSFHLRCYWASWHNISTDLVNCFADVLQLPSLKLVELENVPPQLLNNARPSLKHISLKHHTPAPEPHQCTIFLPNPLKEPLSVESLQILDPYHTDLDILGDWLQGNVCSKQLKRLNITEGDEPGIYLPKILDACSLTLEELVFEPCLRTYDLQDDVPDYLDVSTLVSLRALRVRVDVSVNTSENMLFNPFPWLIKHLDSLPPSNVIEELTIHLNLAGDLDADTLQECQEVSTAILNNLKRLRSVDIHVYCFSSENYHPHTEEILQNMEDLQSKGILRLLRAAYPYKDFCLHPPYSAWNF